ncbi:nucleotide excision repair endonuclease [Cytobacillus solani]|uniref:nucleotide excision repair endonuclease n=1 Tax=Cytobacillus solani TaxID=1637975 RepID=UPI0006F8F221|nr:nucleotide excision repair endonuclease [Cytobacillus solani]
MAISITLPDDKLTFNRVEYKQVKDTLKIKPSGVYFLYDVNGELLYVGKTNNFRSRLLSHFRGRDVSKPFYRLIDSVKVYFVDDNYERELYETYAINTFIPTFNKSKTYYDDKSEELFEIEERIRELEEEASSIREDMCSDGMIDEDFEDDLQLITGIYFLNEERLRAIESEIKSLKKRKALTL